MGILLHLEIIPRLGKLFSFLFLMKGFADENIGFPQNPSKYYFDLKSGVISYYDKEKKESVELEKPEFTIIDTFPAMYRGYDEDLNKTLQTHTIYDWSLPITLFYWSEGKRKEVVKGSWSDELVKLKIKSKANYHKVITVIYKGELAQVVMPNSQWVEFDESGIDSMKNAIVISGKKEVYNEKLKKNFFRPEISSRPLTEEEKENAKMKSREYRDFVNAIKKLSGGEDTHPEHISDWEELPMASPEEKQKTQEIIDKAKGLPEIKYESDIKPEDLPF